MEEKESLRDAGVGTLVTGMILLAFSVSILILRPDMGELYTIFSVLIGILGLMALLAFYADFVKNSVINELKKELHKNSSKPE